MSEENHERDSVHMSSDELLDLFAAAGIELHQFADGRRIHDLIEARDAIGAIHEYSTNPVNSSAYYRLLELVVSMLGRLSELEAPETKAKAVEAREHYKAIDWSKVKWGIRYDGHIVNPEAIKRLTLGGDND
jgi:hypothetical protein